MMSGRRRSMVFLITVSIVVAACTDAPAPEAPDVTLATSAIEEDSLTTSVADADSVLDRVPEDARIAAGEGEPRSAGYWVIWSSCGENNRAETAAANGGREAGWIIMDDLLALPGVSLGEYPVHSCDDGLAILEGSKDDPGAPLARQLFTAELNLNAGSERCRAVDESVAVAQALLASFGYAGPDASLAVEGDVQASVGQVSELLAAYNSGELCR